MKKVAILYICTGRYSSFWDDFYLTCENYFLKHCQKEYFVFTDQKIKIFNSRIHKIRQKKLGWPYDTLFRFKMFNSIKNKLQNFDYIFFLNANIRFVQTIGENILPSNTEKLLAVKHPAFYNKDRSDFSYETNSHSLAFIPSNKGKVYYMGGFNGGIASEYLKLIEHLNASVLEDFEKGIIAKWHDESHLNKYLLDFEHIKVLDPSYGYPEDWDLPFVPKMVILNKEKIGGHEWFRSGKISFFSRIFSYIRNGGR